MLPDISSSGIFLPEICQFLPAQPYELYKNFQGSLVAY